MSDPNAPSPSRLPQDASTDRWGLSPQEARQLRAELEAQRLEVQRYHQLHQQEKAAREQLEARAHEVAQERVGERQRDVAKWQQAERELRETTQRLQLHIENSPLAVVEYDPEFRIIRWAGEAPRIFGWTAEEVVGRRAADLHWIHEEDIPDVARLAGDMLAGRRLRNVHRNRNYRKDGSVICCEWYSSALLDEAGKLNSVFSLALDVTERDRAVEALRQSEERLRFLSESIPHMIWSARPDGHIDYFNQRVLDYTGATDEQMIGWNWLPFVHPDDHAMTMERWTTALREGSEYKIDYRLRHGKTGEFRWHRAHALPMRDGQGRIVRWYGTCTDIDAQKRSEEELRESEYRLKRAQEIAHLGSWELDLLGNRLTWSHEEYRIFGLQPQEFAATYEAFLEIVHPEDRAAVDGAYSGSLREGRDSYEIEHRIIRKPTGEIRIVHEKCEHIRDASGRIIRSVGMTHDITDQKAAEAALRASEQRYRFLTESIPQMVWSADPEGRNLDANSRWEQYTGQPPQQASNNGWAEIIHPEDRPHSIQRWLHALATGETFECEHRMRRASDGSYRWYLARAVPMKDERGRIIRWFGTSTDIHDLKLAQEAVQLNERRLALAIDSAQIGLWDVDLVTGQLTESDRRGPMFGRQLGPAHATVEDWRRDLHPEDRERMTHAIDEAMAGRAEYHCEYRVIGPDGKVRWIDSHGSVLRDGAGRPQRLVGVSIEITKSKEAQRERERLLTLEREARQRAEATAAALRKSEAEMLRLNQQLQRKVTELETIFDIVPIGIAVAEDAECRTIRGNRTFTQMLGVGADANLSKTNPDSQHLLRHRYVREGRDLTAEELPMQRAAATGRPVANVAFDVVRENGSVVRLIGNAAPLVTQDGKTSGAIGAFWDIEQFRRTEDRLRMEKDAAVAASIAKDRFLATLSHELRNPLSTILNALQVSETLSCCVDCPAREHRVIIARQTRHLARLVDDLLDVSRVTAGKITLKKQPLDLAELVRHSVDACRPAFGERRQEVTLDVPSQPLLVEGDAARLEQVMMNLLSNARKYTASGGQVWIRASVEGDEAVVRVRDNGIGIPPEAMPRLFQPFMQVDESLDRSQGGLGLGLALARSLVQMQGGTITAHSAGLNRGCEFVIRLPRLRSAAAPAPQPPTISPAGTTPRRVLLVEDQADARRVLQRLVRLWGHQVEVAADGPEGVEKALTLRPEVALVDIGLPGLNGYEVAQRIRAALGHSIFLIALTGYGQPEDIQHATAAGFDLHLTKPLEPAKLEQVLGEIGSGPGRK